METLSKFIGLLIDVFIGKKSWQTSLPALVAAGVMVANFYGGLQLTAEQQIGFITVILYLIGRFSATTPQVQELSDRLKNLQSRKE